MGRVRRGSDGLAGNRLSEDEALQQAADANVIFNQYGQRNEADRLEVQLPAQVERATWTAAGSLDYWVREAGEWWGTVRTPDGQQTWVRAADFRRASALNQ